MNKYINFLPSLLFTSTVLSCKDNAGWNGIEFVKVQDSIQAPYDIAVDMEFANGKNPEQQKIANIINARLQDEFLEKVDTTNIHSSIKSFINRLCSSYKEEDETFHLERSEHMTGRFEYGISGVINYVLTEDYYGGGAHPTTNTTMLCFNADTGELITVDALVVDSCRHKLMDMLTERLMHNVGATDLDSLYAIGYLDNVNMYISENFKLGADSISFHYNPYDIAPYALGSSTISFSYEELKGIITFTDD